MHRAIAHGRWHPRPAPGRRTCRPRRWHRPARPPSRCAVAPAHRRGPAVRTHGSAARRRRGWRWPRRRPRARSVGRGARHRRPSPAGRRAPASRHVPVRPPPPVRRAGLRPRRSRCRRRRPATGACACRRRARRGALPRAGGAARYRARAGAGRVGVRCAWPRRQNARRAGQMPSRPASGSGSKAVADSGWAGSASWRTRSSACSSAPRHCRYRPTPRS